MFVSIYKSQQPPTLFNLQVQLPPSLVVIAACSKKLISAAYSFTNSANTQPQLLSPGLIPPLQEGRSSLAMGRSRPLHGD